MIRYKKQDLLFSTISHPLYCRVEIPLNRKSRRFIMKRYKLERNYEIKHQLRYSLIYSNLKAKKEPSNVR